MYKLLSRYKIAIIVALVVLAGGSAALWALWPGPGGGAAGDGAILDAIPQAGGESAADRAIARWARRLRLRPGDDGAWAELGDALMQKARETADASYYGHAERVYRRALALDARNVSATAGLSWVFGCRHEFERSVEWASKAVGLDPRCHAAHGLLGDAAMEKGNYDAALEHYQTMLDVRPDVSSYSRGAQLLFVTGDVRKATW